MEGQFRDLVRAIQDARKTAGLTVSDRVTVSLTVNADWKKVVDTFRTEIMQLCGTKEIQLLDGEVKEIPEIRLEK
jgi:isoleucyl-tRNA synthetase